MKESASNDRSILIDDDWELVGHSKCQGLMSVYWCQCCSISHIEITSLNYDFDRKALQYE